jgi:hypothetical protein
LSACNSVGSARRRIGASRAAVGAGERGKGVGVRFLSDAQRSQIEILFPSRRVASNQRGAQYRVYGLGAFHGCFVLRIRATTGRLH